MPLYNLIEYRDNYSKTSGSLWQYYRDISAVKNNDDIPECNGANATDSFSLKAKKSGKNENNRTKHIKIMLPSNYLSNFWTLEMLLINFEINLILTWSEYHVIVWSDVASQGETFEITETKIHVPVSYFINLR